MGVALEKLFTACPELVVQTSTLGSVRNPGLLHPSPDPNERSPGDSA